MVVMKPCSTPKASSKTFTIGAKQLVVQLALDIMVSVPSITSLLTPKTTVFTSPVAGAEITTFFAPASKCIAALAASVKIPVLSKTTSTPIAPHGNNFGSRSANALIFWPLMIKCSASEVTVPGNFP